MKLRLLIGFSNVSNNNFKARFERNRFALENHVTQATLWRYSWQRTFNRNGSPAKHLPSLEAAACYIVSPTSVHDRFRSVIRRGALK